MGKILNATRRLYKAFRLLNSFWGRRGLRHGVGAAIEHHRALRRLSLNTVVDVGANKGQFSLFAAENFPAAAIYAFEPLSEPAAKFRSVLGGRASLFEAAVGPIEKEAPIYVSQRDDSSSLLPITKRQIDTFPGTELKETRTIRVAPLVSFINRVDIRQPALLKIDVQGFELEVIQGCEGLLDAFAYIYVECSFVELYGRQALAADIINHLYDRKFALIGIFNQTEDSTGEAVQADFLFHTISL